jgi:hypothetical protein
MAATPSSWRVSATNRPSASRCSSTELVARPRRGRGGNSVAAEAMKRRTSTDPDRVS